MTHDTSPQLDGRTPQTPEAVREDIERTRAELADTVAQLTHKLDVKARAQTRAQEIAHDPRARRYGAGTVALVVATLAVVVWRKRR